MTPAERSNMKLSDLLKGIDYTVLNGSIDREITILTPSSRQIIKNAVFVCIAGAISNGHKYIPQAEELGACAVIVQDGEALPDIDQAVTIVSTPDTRHALALMSAAYYDYPDRRLFTIGITGTKGKTTTSYMIRNVLEACGIKTGLIGTIETIIDGKSVLSHNTTPESIQLHKSFHEMVQAGCKAVVMEVSSQGIKQDRTAGIIFDIGVFTNLSPDHIGPNEHDSFEDYASCKARLFSQCKTGIVNADDGNILNIIKDATCRLETFGFSESANLRAVNVKLHNNDNVGISFDCQGLSTISASLKMLGKFSVYNALTAIAVTRHFNVPDEIVAKTLRTVTVKGRIEILDIPADYTVMIDFAHNAISLESILLTLKEYNPNRLICLFGSVGERSQGRRYEMGEISGQLADLSVLTSDNPKNENPLDIISDIAKGVQASGGKYVSIPDRRDAIIYALENAGKGDIILLAGKGHENYQEIGNKAIPFDEREIVNEYFAKNK